MSTAQEIVIDAYRSLHAIDIVDAAPSPSEMAQGLRWLQRMIDGWAADGLSIADQTRTCVIDGTGSLITNPIDPLTGAIDTLRLAPGMNASGTGVAGRIRSLDHVKHQIQMSQNTTIAGSAVSVTFTALPFEDKFELGVVALLAMEFAPLIGEDNPPAWIARRAQTGWTALQANFMQIPPVGFDPALVLTSVQRTTSAIPNG